MRKALIAITIVLLTSLAGSAQTDAQFTQFYEVPTYYNPAAAGQSPLLRIRAGSRLQWLGIDKAPVTFIGLADTKLKVGSKFIGLGALVQSESAGLFNNLTAGLQIGYKLKILKGELTIGLQPGLINEKFRGSEVFIPDDDNFHQSADEAIPTNDVAGTAFDLGAGLWYVHPKFHLGLSMTHLLNPTVTFESSSGSAESNPDAKKFQFEARRTLYFMAGCNIPIKNTLFEVMPSVLVKSDFRWTGAEASARLRYNKFLTAGLGYRYNDAITATLSAEIKGFFIGYSFDYPLTAINRASAGSHEIFAGYSLKLDFSEKNKNKHKSIRLL